VSSAGFQFGHPFVLGAKWRFILAVARVGVRLLASDGGPAEKW
jgi:hypothetical protein